MLYSTAMTIPIDNLSRTLFVRSSRKHAITTLRKPRYRAQGQTAAAGHFARVPRTLDRQIDRFDRTLQAINFAARNNRSRSLTPPHVHRNITMMSPSSRSPRQHISARSRWTSRISSFAFPRCPHTIPHSTMASTSTQAEPRLRVAIV